MADEQVSNDHHREPVTGLGYRQKNQSELVGLQQTHKGQPTAARLKRQICLQQPARTQKTNPTPTGLARWRQTKSRDLTAKTPHNNHLNLKDRMVVCNMPMLIAYDDTFGNR